MQFGDDETPAMGYKTLSQLDVVTDVTDIPEFPG